MSPQALLAACSVLMLALTGVILLLLAALERRERGPSRYAAGLACVAALALGSGLLALFRFPL